MESQAECMLVIIGATPEGRKELVGFQVVGRESTQSWRELLIDLKARGLSVPARTGRRRWRPGVLEGDGRGLPLHTPLTFHKASNVLNHFPKSMQPAVTVDLPEVSNAETRAAALLAIETFKEKYTAKFERGVACLTKNTERSLYSTTFPPMTIRRSTRTMGAPPRRIFRNCHLSKIRPTCYFIFTRLQVAMIGKAVSGATAAISEVQ